MRPGEENLDGPPIHGNTRLEIIWTAIPSIIIVGLCVYAFTVLSDIEDAPADQPERQVTVTGQQFAWTFEYNEGGRKFANTQLYLPVGESVKFNVRSNDVIHDFWVPDFRMKIDAVPGIDTELKITPRRVGEYPVICAELCGLGHSVMRQSAHVVERAEFDNWVQERAAAAAEGGGGEEAGGEAPDGKAIFTGDLGCGGCHALADAGTTGSTGPDLDENLAGKDEAYIEESIVDPSAQIADGFQDGIMPTNFGDRLEPAQLDALVKYLAEVTD
jgi:cytochrome c oxidase subunit II